MADVVNRVPPQNLDAEQSLLGAMMLSEEAIAKAVEMIDADDFYQASHRAIFLALLELFQNQRPCDSVTLTEVLLSRNQLADVGGATYLAQLLNSPPTAANAEHYAEIVKHKALLRRLIGVAGDISREAFEPQAEADLLLDVAEHKILDLSQKRTTRPYSKMKDLVPETFYKLEQLYESKQSITGVGSGFKKLDEYTAGFQPSDLIIVAARPSMGKTAFCLNIAMNAANLSHTGTLIFSLEMARHQLVQRLMCSEARIDGSKLRRGFLSQEDWGKLTMTAGVLSESPILIDDTPGIGLLELRSKARRAKAQDNIGLIIIDYLQLIQGPPTGNKNENRQNEISAISRGLKGLAREIEVPVICLSQLSRAVESRTDKRPVLSDLRESGAIEQDADVVIFLYRDIYYTKKEESRGKAEVIIAKQRNGPVGSLEMAFFSEFARFDNLENIYGEEG